MRDARDTFLHFLADNLSLDVHNLRQDPQDQEASRLHTEAVNVQFLRDDLNIQVGSFLVAIDCISSNELTAVDMSEQLWQVLSAGGYTPQLNYSVPASPTSLGTNLFWNPNSVSFKPVSDINYRYSCLLRVKYHAH